MIPLLETPMPQLGTVAIAAFAPLPKEFGERDRQRLAVAVRVLGDGSQEYARRQVFEITDGDTVHAALLPDGVLIRFEVPKANLTNGLALMDGLLRRPTVQQESLDAALRRAQRAEVGTWAAALRPYRNDLKGLRADEARAVLLRVFDPRRVVVAAIGGFAAGTASARWSSLTADWKPLPEPRYPDISIAPEPTTNPSGVGTVELRGRAFSANDPTLPARWLALLGLGVGKGSSLFQDVRQIQGWSYRQEAVLWPDRAGLVPRLVLASNDESAGRTDDLRTTLLKSIGSWSEEDRTRALGAASLHLGPLWLADSPVGESPLERASLDAYWYAKAGVAWDPDRLLNAMKNVSLSDMKAAATEMVSAARAITLAGHAC